MLLQHKNLLLRFIQYHYSEDFYAVTMPAPGKFSGNCIEDQNGRLFEQEILHSYNVDGSRRLLSGYGNYYIYVPGYTSFEKTQTKNVGVHRLISFNGSKLFADREFDIVPDDYVTEYVLARENIYKYSQDEAESKIIIAKGQAKKIESKDDMVRILVSRSGLSPRKLGIDDIHEIDMRTDTIRRSHLLYGSLTITIMGRNENETDFLTWDIYAALVAFIPTLRKDLYSFGDPIIGGVQYIEKSENSEIAICTITLPFQIGHTWLTRSNRPIMNGTDVYSNGEKIIWNTYQE